MIYREADISYKLNFAKYELHEYLNEYTSLCGISEILSILLVAVISIGYSTIVSTYIATGNLVFVFLPPIHLYLSIHLYFIIFNLTVITIITIIAMTNISAMIKKTNYMQTDNIVAVLNISIIGVAFGPLFTLSVLIINLIKGVDKQLYL